MKKITIIISVFFILLFFSCNKNNFAKNTIDAISIINQINKGENIELVDKTISGKLDFTTIKKKHRKSPFIFVTYVPVSITFVNCTFTDSISAYKEAEKFAYITEFQGSVTFLKCTFEKSVNFRQTNFIGDIDFSGSTYNEDLKFVGTYFLGQNNYFRDSKFNANAQFSNSNFVGDVIFMNSMFSNKAEFNNCYFSKNVNFSSCTYSKVANFENIYVNGYFKTNYNVYNDKVFFTNCKFNGRLEMVKINSKLNFNFSNNICNDFVNMNAAFFDGIFTFEHNLFNYVKNDFEKIATSETCKTQITNNLTNSYTNYELKINNIE